MDPKQPICPNENFFRKPLNEPCFFYSYLSRCKKSKSDINLFVKYWQLKNTAEISLAWRGFFVIIWEPDFSHACSFCRMLMNHKNFHLTWRDFLKKSKNHVFGSFLTIFRSFLPNGDFFQKNPALSHKIIYGPVTPG